MTFNSLSFLAFLPIVVAGYYLLPHRFRWVWLLIASCYFYMAFVPAYILILAALVFMDYFLALAMEAETDPRKRCIYFLIGIISNFALLFVFKYFNFFNVNVESLAHFFGWNYSIGMLRLLLPLGLSFHTFQCVSYLVEVYQGRQKAERHIGMFALFVMFFPQLVAGPIERASHLLPQFYAKHSFELWRIGRGLELIAWGFFLKIAIADRAALIVNALYANPSAFAGPAVLLGVVFFAFQLYGDFAGYTAIARGAACMLGFDLVLNFNRPYLARSVGEFWQRWHISLSTWLRDYVYMPVLRFEGRVSERAIYIAVLVTFLASGLWHGAGWNFVGMGLWFGLVIVFELSTRHVRARIGDVLGLGRIPFLVRIVENLLMFAAVLVGWTFFRSTSIATVGTIISGVFQKWHDFSLPFGYEPKEIAITAALAALLMSIEILAECGVPASLEKFRLSWFGRGFCFAFLALLVLAFGQFHTTTFIYFQF